MGIGLDAHYDSKIFSGFEISARDLSFRFHQVTHHQPKNKRKNYILLYL